MLVDAAVAKLWGRFSFDSKRENTRVRGRYTKLEETAAAA